MRKIVLTHGLIAGAIMSATLLATMVVGEADFDGGAFIGYTSMVVAFLMVYFGVRAYRDEVAGGAISFMRALMVGLAITAVGSVCYVATWELVYFKLKPGFVEKYTDYTLNKEKAAGATADELEAKRQEMLAFKEMYDNPIINSAITFLEPLPVGLLASLLTAVTVRRGRREGNVVEAAL